MGILEEKIRTAFAEAANEHAREALLKPNKDTDMVFSYGQASGYQLGLQAALDLVLKVMREEDQRNGRENEPDEF